MENVEKLLEYIGDPNQLLSVQESVLSGGTQEGVRTVQVHNGGNLSVVVLPDRCMDLYQVRYKGLNLNYLAPCGIVAPSYYDAQGSNWLRSFFVGMLTTMGLQHIGGAAVGGDGEVRGLHGRIANAPAQGFRYDRRFDADGMVLTMEGTMREARLFGENLTLHRKLTFAHERDSLILEDTITNHGFDDRQVLYGLHLNYGYPLLEEGSQVIIDSEEVTASTAIAQEHIDTWSQVEAPAFPYPERCYHHKIRKAEDGTAQYILFNPKRNIGVRVRFDGNKLPFFCQWKMLGKGEYVMGLEPTNTGLSEPKFAQPGCPAPVLAHGESLTYRVVIDFIDSLDA